MRRYLFPEGLFSDMTNDKVTYTLKFKYEVSQGAVSTIRDANEPNVCTVEIETDGDLAYVTVWGDSNAISVYEEKFKSDLFELYPSAEIIDTDIEVGKGPENSP